MGANGTAADRDPKTKTKKRNDKDEHEDEDSGQPDSVSSWPGERLTPIDLPKGKGAHGGPQLRRGSSGPECEDRREQTSGISTDIVSICFRPSQDFVRIITGSFDEMSRSGETKVQVQPAVAISGINFAHY